MGLVGLSVSRQVTNKVSFRVKGASNPLTMTFIKISLILKHNLVRGELGEGGEFGEESKSRVKDRSNQLVIIPSRNIINLMWIE